ncbi:MAG: YggT family protein [Alphaproteobacteria bacterium]|nr:YggT family protein [Alphaproteobacteria bacterium]
MGLFGALGSALLDVLSIVVGLYFKVVAVDIILYWLLHYQIMSVHNKYAEKFMEILKMLTEPVYKLIRKKVPPLSGHDISPYVLLLFLLFIGIFISNFSNALKY